MEQNTVTIVTANGWLFSDNENDLLRFVSGVFKYLKIFLIRYYTA